MVNQTLSRGAIVRLIVGFGAVGGVTLGVAGVIAGVIARMPDYEQGHTGVFGAGFGIAVDAVFLVPVGIGVGVGAGLVIAAVWWIARGRFLPPSPRLDGGTPYPVPPLKG
ncbi:MAG TPA: hypothetical protein VGM38_08850 [Pseudolysinimonas sp.]|jgi:hypothetical protein